MLSLRRRDLPALSEDLLARLRARDPQAQAEVERALGPRLRRLAKAQLDPSAAEGLVHDAFSDFFFRHVDGLESARAIPAYLQMTVIRRSRRAAERAARHEPLTEAAAEAPDVEETVQARRERARLAACLDRLTLRAREIVKLHYGHGLPLADIGARQARSKQAVHKALGKALDALRACVEEVS